MHVGRDKVLKQDGVVEHVLRSAADKGAVHDQQLDVVAEPCAGVAVEHKPLCRL